MRITLKKLKMILDDKTLLMHNVVHPYSLKIECHRMNTRWSFYAFYFCGDDLIIRFTYNDEFEKKYEITHEFDTKNRFSYLEDYFIKHGTVSSGLFSKLLYVTKEFDNFEECVKFIRNALIN